MRLRPETNLLVIDSDTTVGGVWSEKRLYPNLVAQVKHGLFNYTDTRMPKHGSTKNEMVTGRMIHNYLQTYAEDHDLLRRIRFSTFVESVERCDRGWRLRFKDSTDTIETVKLLVATGVTSIPNLPELDNNDGTIPLIHSKDLGEQWKDVKSEDIERVIVLGAAKSAYDAVYLLLEMGKKVEWVIRPHGAGPLAILPSEIFGLVSSIAVASTRLMTYLSPSILNTQGALASFFHRSTVGQYLTGTFWNVVNYASAAHAGYTVGDHVAGLKPEIDGKSYVYPLAIHRLIYLTNNFCSIFWANSGLGVVTLPNFWQKIHAGNVTVVRDEPQSISQGLLEFSSGKSLAADYIVACTGWGDHFGMFNEILKTEIGLPAVSNKSTSAQVPRDLSWESEDIDADKSVNKQLPFIASPPGLTNPQTNNVRQRRWRLYRRAIPIELALRNDRSLVILGQIHTVQTPLVSEMQSFWAILYLLGELDLPEESVMRKEVAEWNAWTRKRYLSQGQKFPYSLYDFLPVSLPLP